MRRPSDRGAVAVETILVIVFVLVPLLIGVTDYGRALYTSIIIEEVAQEGANLMAFSGASAAQVENELVNTTGYPTLTTADIDVTCAAVTRSIAGTTSRATVTISYSLDAFFLPAFDLSQQAVAEGSEPCGS